MDTNDLRTPGQISLHGTLTALGNLQNAFPAFARRWTERSTDRPNDVLLGSLAACGVTSASTIHRFRTALTRIPAGNARECQAALEKTTGIWCSAVTGQDTKVVFTDRPIDALAYQEYRAGEKHIVVSIGRELPPELRVALKQAIDGLPPDKTLVAAFANDLSGATLAKAIDGLATGRKVIHEAPPRGRTWCDTNIDKHRDLIRSLGHTPWIDFDRGR